MMICPNLKCRKVLQVPGQYRGQQVKCHYCTTTFSVPLAKSDKQPAEKKPAEKKPAEAKAEEK
jgi:hypothetical protein